MGCKNIGVCVFHDQHTMMMTMCSILRICTGYILFIAASFYNSVVNTEHPISVIELVWYTFNC